MKIQAFMGVVFAAVAFTGCANNGSNITAESVTWRLYVIPEQTSGVSMSMALS